MAALRRFDSRHVNIGIGVNLTVLRGIMSRGLLAKAGLRDSCATGRVHTVAATAAFTQPDQALDHDERAAPRRQLLCR